MTPSALLAALHDLGAEAYRLPGDMIRLRPADKLTAEIIGQFRARKADLLPLLPPLPAELPPVAPSAAADLLATYGTRDDLAVQVWAETHGHPDVLPVFGRLARRVDALAEGTDEAAYHVAVERLAGYLTAIREAYEANQAQLEAPALAPTPGQWRIVVGAMKLKPAPVELDRARVVVDVPAFVESTLAEVERTLALRNSGRGTYLADVTDERLEQLRLCGCEVAVEVVQ